MPTVNQTTNTPTTKVTAATALGAVAALLAWVDDRFFSDFVPGYIEACVITLAVFAGGYFVRNRVTDSPPAPGELPDSHINPDTNTLRDL